MNTRKKIYIVNNQEDEDGENLYSCNMVNIKRISGIITRSRSLNKKAIIVKFPLQSKFVTNSIVVNKPDKK